MSDRVDPLPLVLDLAGCSPRRPVGAMARKRYSWPKQIFGVSFFTPAMAAGNKVHRWGRPRRLSFCTKSRPLLDRDGNLVRNHGRIEWIVTCISQHELKRVLAGWQLD